MGDLSGYGPQTRFTDRADAYAKYRPTYPLAAIDYILEGYARPATLRIADIGAGTGISSRLLAERVGQVVAVDPNPAMLALARRHTRVRYVEAAAEATGLPAGTFDLVTCFQAFHWFSRDAAMTEFVRILKRRGRLCAVWNNRDREDPFTARYSDFIESFGEDVAVIDRGKSLSPPEETFEAHGLVRVRRSEFKHFHRMDLESFIGYARSTSYLPTAGTEFERLREGLRELYDRFADSEGYVTFPYRTAVYRGEAAGASPK